MFIWYVIEKNYLGFKEYFIKADGSYRFKQKKIFSLNYHTIL